MCLTCISLFYLCVLLMGGFVMTNKFTKLMTLGCLVLLVSGLSISCGGDDDSSSTASTSTASTSTSTASTSTASTSTASTATTEASTATNVVTGIAAYSEGQKGEVAKATPVTCLLYTSDAADE